MSTALVSHPRCVSERGVTIAADVARAPGGILELTYRLSGDIVCLRIPPPATPARRNELWRHTCFEAFVAPATGTDYVEFNLSPSGEWAAYRFEDYRAGMADLPTAAPQVTLDRSDDGLTLSARLTLPDALAGVPLRVSLAAVLEDPQGALSYRALHHPAERPDFHHRDGFTLEL